MPRIPRTERQVGLSITQQPYGNFGGEAVGQAVSKLGGAIADFGDVAMTEKNQLDDFNANMAYVDWKNGQDIKQQEYDLGIEGDGRHHLTNRIAGFDQDAAQFYSQLPDNPKIRQRYAVRLQADRGDYGMKSYGAQQTHVQNWYASQGEKYVSQTVMPHLDGTPQSLERGLSAVDTMIEGSPGIKPEIADKIREQAAKNVFKTWLDKAGPDAAVNADELLKRYRTPETPQPLEGEILPPENGGAKQGVLNREAPRLPSQGKAGGPSGPAADKPQADAAPEPQTLGSGPRFSAPVNAAIETAAAQAGIDPAMLRVFAKIESSGNPRARTGSYKGLFQLSNEEFAKHGGGDIYNATDNANAAALKMRAEMAQFAREHGRNPTPAELYMIHQQGAAGSRAHWSNPDELAWKNMQKASGRSAAWAKLAIWGNVPTDVRRRFGNVNNITSKDFTDLWDAKVAKWAGGPQMTKEAIAVNDKFKDQVADESGRVLPRAPMTTRDYFYGLLESQQDAIKKHALHLERTADAEEKKIKSADEKAAHREGLELLYGRKLTNDWITANKARLSNEHYALLLRAVNPRPSMTDPQTHVDLLERADEDPDEVMERAGEAYANRQISQTAFDQIYRKAQKAKSDETRLPGWVSEQRQLVKRTLRPPASASEDDLKDYTAALEQFDAYVDERHGDKAGQGPDGKGKTTLDRKELTDFAQKLVHEQKTKRVGNVRRNLSLPRYTQVARDALSLEELQQSIRRTADAYKAGKLSKSELAAEISNLKKWQDLLMSEGAATSRMDFAKGLRNTTGR